MICEWCGRVLVEVDNPWRREIRHRRGEEVSCPGRTVRYEDLPPNPNEEIECGACRGTGSRSPGKGCDACADTGIRGGS